MGRRVAIIAHPDDTGRALPLFDGQTKLRAPAVWLRQCNSKRATSTTSLSPPKLQMPSHSSNMTTSNNDEWLEEIPEQEEKFSQFYYGGRGGYALRHNGRFIPLSNETQVRAHLKQQGVAKGDIEDTLCRIRLENFVCHIGPVAGFPAGIHQSEDSGESILVTIGPRIIEPVQGEWPFIREFFTELLADDAYPQQFASFLSWFAQARRNLIQRKRRPLPATICVGPRNCGKTLLGEIVRLGLGGRAAPALGSLNGTTAFNAPTAGAELLQIDDEIANRDHRARIGLAQGIKRQLFGSSVRVEGKHKDAVTLRPIQALMIAVNDEAEHLQVLPQLDDTLRDKVALFQCHSANLRGLEDRDEIERHIKDELPALVYDLENFSIPRDLSDPRTGVAAWQHPNVIKLLNLISPEERLRELLTQCSFITNKIGDFGFWEGTAAEVERLLNSNETTRYGARSLLSWTAAAGTYLGRLSTTGRANITKRVLHGTTLWRIEG